MKLLLSFFALHSALAAFDACKADSDCDYAVDSHSCPIGIVAVAKERKTQFYREENHKKKTAPCTKALARENDDRFVKPACVTNHCALITKSPEELKQNPGYCDSDDDCGLYRIQSFQAVAATNKRMLPDLVRMRLALEKGRPLVTPKDRIEDFKAVCREHDCVAVPRIP